MSTEVATCVTDARALLKSTRTILRQATVENCDRVRQLLPQVRKEREYELASWLGLLLVHLQRIMGQHREALSVLDRALVDAGKAKSRLAQCRVTSLRGIILRDTGKYTEAVDAFRQVLSLGEELADQQQIWNALTGMGSISNVRQDWTRSLYWYRRALAVSRVLKDDARRANSLNHLAEVLDKRGHLKASLRLRLRALTLVSGRYLEHTANINSGIARQLMQLHEYADARFYALTAYSLHRRQGNVMGQQEALQTLAHSYANREETSKALLVQRKAWSLAAGLENPTIMYHANRALAEVLFQSGAIAEATGVIRECAHALAKLNQQEKHLIISRMETTTTAEQLRTTNRRLEEQISDLRRTEERSRRIEKDLQARVVLKEMLHEGIRLCNSCGRVQARDEAWQPIDHLLASIGVSLFSHSLCPTCVSKLFPNLSREGRSS